MPDANDAPILDFDPTREALLDPARLDSHGLLDTAAVRRCWHEHVVLGRQHQARLWDVLMFQAWHEEVFV